MNNQPKQTKGIRIYLVRYAVSDKHGYKLEEREVVKQLSEILGVSHRQVRRYASGANRLPETKIDTLVDFFQPYIKITSEEIKALFYPNEGEVQQEH